MSQDSAAVETLRRWEAAGGHWRVLSRGSAGLAVALLRCDAGEEMQRVVSQDAAFARYIGDRESSEQEPGDGDRR